MEKERSRRSHIGPGLTSCVITICSQYVQYQYAVAPGREFRRRALRGTLSTDCLCICTVHTVYAAAIVVRPVLPLESQPMTSCQDGAGVEDHVDPRSNYEQDSTLQATAVLCVPVVLPGLDPVSVQQLFDRFAKPRLPVAWRRQLNYLVMTL